MRLGALSSELLQLILEEYVWDGNETEILASRLVCRVFNVAILAAARTFTLLPQWNGFSSHSQQRWLITQFLYKEIRICRFPDNQSLMLIRAVNETILARLGIEPTSAKAEQCLDRVCATFGFALSCPDMRIPLLMAKDKEHKSNVLNFVGNLDLGETEKNMPGYILGVALYWNNLALVNTAFDMGADPSQDNPVFGWYGWVLKEGSSYEVAILVLQKGLRVSVDEPADIGNPEMARACLNSPFQNQNVIWDISRFGWKAIRRAASFGHIEYVKVLLEYAPFDQDRLKQDLGSAILDAASQNRLEMVKFLVAAGGSIDIGIGALYHAGGGRHANGFADRKLVELILSLLSEVECQKSFLLYGLAGAARNGDHELMRRLASFDVRPSDCSRAVTMAFERAAVSNSEPFMTTKLLVQLGADPKQSGDAVFLAIDSGRTEIAKFLLEHGADPNWPVYHPTVYARKITMLGYFAFYGDTEKVKFILEMGAEVNYRQRWVIDSAFSVALHVTPNPKKEIIEIMLEHGADFGAQRYAYQPSPCMRYIVERNDPVVMEVVRNHLEGSKILAEYEHTS